MKFSIVVLAALLIVVGTSCWPALCLDLDKDQQTHYKLKKAQGKAKAQKILSVNHHLMEF